MRAPSTRRGALAAAALFLAEPPGLVPVARALAAFIDSPPTCVGTWLPPPERTAAVAIAWPD